MAKLKSSLFNLNYEEGTKNGQSSITDNIAYTWRGKSKQKHNTICVGHHCAQTKTDNVNKTRTTGGKDEPNIIFIRTLQRTSQRGAPEGLKVSTSYKTPVVLLIIIYSQVR
jgi:hypothetical protein